MYIMADLGKGVSGAHGPMVLNKLHHVHGPYRVHTNG